MGNWRCRSTLGLVAATMAVVGLLMAAGQAGAATPGYWLSAGDGGVFSFNAPFWGSAAGNSADCPPAGMDRGTPFSCSVMAARPDGQGYWILGSAESTIYAFGAATNLGQPANTFRDLNLAEYQIPEGSGIASTPSGDGYWVAESSGQVFAYGNATSYGDASSPILVAITEAAPSVYPGLIAGMAATPDGHGYWLVGGDGGVFAYGDAQFYGSMGGKPLNAPIVGIAAAPDGKGYWLVASDGGIFAFGDAMFSGSMGRTHLNAPMTGIAANPDGGGYWTVASDGGVFAFGGAPFEGSMGGQRLSSPVLGMATKG